MSARDYDTHTVEVTYRTERMRDAAAAKWPKYGWKVQPDGSTSLLVRTFKPESLFGPIDADPLLKNPGTDAGYRAETNWKEGVVSWRLACGCSADRLETSYALQGVEATLQPMGEGGRVFYPAAEYIIERVSWSCVAQDDRALVCVRTPDEDGWRGRMIRVSEDVLRGLMAGQVPA
jgi:hypothetical protein